MDESYPLRPGAEAHPAAPTFGKRQTPPTNVVTGVFTGTPVRLKKATTTITREEAQMLVRHHNKMLAEGYVNEILTAFVLDICAHAFAEPSHVDAAGFIQSRIIA